MSRPSLSDPGNTIELDFLWNWTHALPDTDTAISKGDDLVLPQIKYLVSEVFTPICCILGMAGNALAVITWSRPALRSSTGRLLSAQAVADFGVLLTSILIIAARQWYPILNHDVAYATFFSYVAMPLYYFFVHCSVWLTLTVTIERYIMVCWVTHAKRLTGENQALIGIIIIIISSLVGNIPHFFMYGVTPHDMTSDGDVTKPVLRPTEFGTGNSAKTYGLYISCISLIAVPWFAVLFFNYKIVSKISSTNRRMLDKKTSESSLRAKKTEAQITRLLLVVTLAYLMAMGPYCLLQIAIILHADGVDPYKKRVAATVTKSGYVINSSLNFILYCMMGRRFRRELKLMLGIKLSEADMTSAYTTSSDAGPRSDGGK